MRAQKNSPKIYVCYLRYDVTEFKIIGGRGEYFIDTASEGREEGIKFGQGATLGGEAIRGRGGGLDCEFSCKSCPHRY